MRYGGVESAWFKGRLSDRNLSQRQLAKHLGLDPAAVSLMLRGRRKANAKEIAEMARLLGVGVDEVMTRLGAGVPVKRASSVEGRVEAVAAIERPAEGGDMLNIPVPMSDGSTATLSVPRALTKADADRIAALVAAFALR